MNLLGVETANCDSPAYCSPRYIAQLPMLKLVQDCYEGQEAIARAGARYLPSFEGESVRNYNERLKASTFWNAYRRTVVGLVGMVYRRNPVLESDVPDKIRKACENIDLMGTHLDVFSKDAFQWSIAEGHSAILVDMPPKIVGKYPAVTNRNTFGRRPYYSMIRKQQIINPIVEQVDGVSKLTQVTIRESITRRKGKYGEEPVECYRVLWPGGWELFEQAEGHQPESKGGGKTSLSRIPLAIISTGAIAPWISRPSLLDLAHENLRLYRLQSALDCILQVANVPVMVEIQGDNDSLDGQITAGALTEKPGKKPRRVISPKTIYTVGHGGDLKYVQHDGKAIDKAQEEIATSKRNIATLGLTILQNSQGGPQGASTATEEVFEREMETSELAGMARTLEDGLEQALEFHAEYEQLDSGGSVKVNRDFTRINLDGAMVIALATVVEKGGMSLETMYGIFEQGSLVGSDFDPNEELQKILSEHKILEAIRKPQPAAA